MKHDLNFLADLPPEVRFQIENGLLTKPLTQSELAYQQRLVIQTLHAHTNQGRRNDLAGASTCTQGYVQVDEQRRRRQNCTEKAAKYYGESASTIRKRIDCPGSGRG